MQVLATFFTLAVVLVAPSLSKPVWSDLVIGNYRYPSAIIDTQSQYLQDPYTPYFVYNVQTDVKAIPAAVVANPKPVISHVPAYNFYYGTPVYDFRFPLNPVYPVARPPQPGLPPKPTQSPTSTTKPSEEEDGIEKLDTKVEPEMGMEKPSQSNDNDESNDDDSVTIEAI